MSEQECEFCRGEFEHTVIKKYDNWTLQLFLNQYYLGRCLVKLDRHTVDLTGLREEERRELFENVLPSLKAAIDETFSPDLYNYSSLGNDCRHLHLHVIPRYRDERKFNKTVFRDENWNSHYTPYPKDFEVTDATFEKIKSEIQQQLD